MNTTAPTVLLDNAIVYNASFNLPTGMVTVRSSNNRYIYGLVDIAIARGIWFAISTKSEN